MTKMLFAGVAGIVCFAAAEGKTLFSEDFEGNTSKWLQPGTGWYVEPGVGTGGSKALVWRGPKEGKKPKNAEYTLNTCRPGMKIEVSYRVKILEKADKPPRMQFSDLWWGGKKVGGASGVPAEMRFDDYPEDADGWRTVKYTVPHLRSVTTYCIMRFHELSRYKGTLAVDDVSLRLVERRAISRSSTSAYRNRSREGVVAFAAGVCFDASEHPIETVACKFTYRGASGEKRTVFADELNYRWARVKLDTDDFAVGKNDVEVSLETAGGEILDRSTIPFERLAPDAKMPRVYLDGCGRAIVGGKRFFPLGMFWHNRDYRRKPEALTRYVKGPFNCLQTYEHNVTPEMLDHYWKHGLYVLPALNEGFYLIGSMKRPAYNLRKGIKTEADARAMLTDYVRSIKDHPAILAWYTNDEFFPWMAPLLCERAELIRRVDGGEHPHYGVGNMVGFVKYLYDGFDVFGPDIYCIRMVGSPQKWLEKDRANVSYCVVATEGMIADCGGDLHIWPVPQAFARGWDTKRGSESWHKYHFPTALEFRAMCWQYIAVGANGLLHYAYGQMLHHLKGDALEEAWKTVCDASAEVKAQIPVLLKDEGPKPRNVPKDARVRTWRDEGAVYALVCNLKPEMLAGKVDFDCKGALAEHLTGDGRAVRVPGGLKFELGPFQHALVRIAVR